MTSLPRTGVLFGDSELALSLWLVDSYNVKWWCNSC